jgi:DNA-binding transcriptional MerR regulator
MPVRRYDIVLWHDERQRMTLDEMALHAGVHPALVERFVDFGLLQPLERDDARLFFKATDVPRLRTICRLRESLGINLAGIAVVLDLLDKLWAVQRENEVLRSRLE